MSFFGHFWSSTDSILLFHKMSGLVLDFYFYKLSRVLCFRSVLSSSHITVTTPHSLPQSPSLSSFLSLGLSLSVSSSFYSCYSYFTLTYIYFVPFSLCHLCLSLSVSRSVFFYSCYSNFSYYVSFCIHFCFSFYDPYFFFSFFN